jgi:hypothetical protein
MAEATRGCGAQAVIAMGIDMDFTTAIDMGIGRDDMIKPGSTETVLAI